MLVVTCGYYNYSYHPSRRHQKRSWSFRVPADVPLVLLGVAPCNLGPLGRHPLQPCSSCASWSLRPSGRCPTIAALQQGTQLPPVCSGDHRESKSLWSWAKISLCEICEEKEKERNLTIPRLNFENIRGRDSTAVLLHPARVEAGGRVR